MSDDVASGMSADGYFIWGKPAEVAATIQQERAALQKDAQEKAQRAERAEANREGLKRTLENTSPPINEPPAPFMPESDHEPDR